MNVGASSPEIDAEIRRNAEIRAARRRSLDRQLAHGQGRLRRWARWAAEPVKAALLDARVRIKNRGRDAAIAAYLAGTGFKGLHVGCGPFLLPGWQNTDRLAPRGRPVGFEAREREIDFHLDITEPLPYPARSLDAVFAEEVIEHVGWREGEAFFAEARRVLANGGVLRLATPDARGLARVFSGGCADVAPGDFEPYWLNPDWREDIWFNGQFYLYGHRHLWTFEAMRDALRAAGFARVERVHALETVSGRAELEGLERHAVTNPEIIRITRETRLVVEAFA